MLQDLAIAHFPPMKAPIIPQVRAFWMSLAIGLCPVALLPADQFGLFTYAQFWQMIFLSLALFGTGRILSRQIGGDRPSAEGYVATNISLRLLTGCLAMLGCALVALDPGLTPQGRDLLLLFAVALLARSIAAWAQHVFIAFEVTRLGLRQELVFRSLEVLLGLIVLGCGGGLIAVAVVHAVSRGLQAVSGWRIVNKAVVRIRFDWAPSRLLDLARLGLVFAVTGIAIVVMMQGSLILYRFLFPDLKAIGQLAIVLQALGVLSMAPRSLAASALPVLSRFVAEGAGDERRSMPLMLRASMIGAAGLAFLATVIASDLVAYLLGEGYRPAAELLGPALWILLPLSIGLLLNQLTTARGHFGSAALNPGLGALAMVLTAWLIADGQQIAGVLLGVGIGTMVWACAECWLALRRGWFDGLGGLGRPALAIGLSLLAFWLLADHSPWLALMIAWALLVPGLASPKVLVARLLAGRRAGSDR